MSEKNCLNSWYKSINENDILPNGAIKLTVPVIDSETEEKVVVQSSPCGNQEDQVVRKTKDSALGAFVLSKRIQDLLLKTSGLNNPYDEDSEERQMILDKVKMLYNELGEQLSAL